LFLTIPLYDDTPRRTMPLATYGLIGLCIAVFLWQDGLSERASVQVSYALGMVPAVLFGHDVLPRSLRIVPPWATLFTSMFLHGGWLHLGGNMLYLWIFGKGVESALGLPRYLLLFLACGAAAALTQAAIDPASHVPMIGASGAIAGVLGAYLLLYPRANVIVFLLIVVFVRLIAVPAALLLGLWFLMQLLDAATANAGEPGVAFWAHVGGFIVGMGLVIILRRHGTAMFQASRTHSFRVAHLRDARQGFGGGSVPAAGRKPWRRRGPWG